LEKGQAFGGDILTSTDIALKGGLFTEIGEEEKVQCSKEEAKMALEEIRKMIEEAVDRIKVISF